MAGREAWPKRKELAQKALALDPDLADAHLSLGGALFALWDWQGGENEIKRALELNPNLALVYDQFAFIRDVFGQFDQAIANEKKAVEIDPLSPLFNGTLGWWLTHARRYDEAIEQARKTLEVDPGFARAHELLGWAAMRKGDSVGAIAEFQKGKALDPQPYWEGNFGHAYAVAGDRMKAEQILRGLDDLAKQRYVSPAIRVSIYQGLGDKGKTYEWLDRCYEERDPACWFLKVEPSFDNLRPEPRFQALLKKVGLDK